MRKDHNVIVSEISNIISQRQVSIINCTFNTISNLFIPTIDKPVYNYTYYLLI